jgi:mono/diheme cytochrome c family protein
VIDNRITIGMVFVLISMIVLTIYGIQEQGRLEERTESEHARAIQRGAVIFEENCSECHGPNGGGVLGRAPALNTGHFFDPTVGRLKEVSYNGSIESFVTLTVTGGRPVKSDTQYAQPMPTWGQQYGGPLREDQVNDVVAFVLNWAGEPRGEAGAGGAAGGDCDPDDSPCLGLQAFSAAGCVACHTVADYSNAVVGPELTNVFAERGPDHIRESIMNPNAVITEGFTADVMPQNLGELLTPEQIDNIIAFLEDVSSQ